MRNFLLSACTLAAGILFTANTAQAETITQFVTVGGGTPSVTTDLNDVAYSTMLNQFNAAAIAAANPGYTVTLSDVILRGNTLVQTGGTLQNQAANTQNFRFDLSLEDFITGTGSGSAVAAQSIVLQQFGAGTGGDQTADFGRVSYTNVLSGATVNYPNASNSSSQTLTNSYSASLTDAASLAAFTGAGSFGLGLNTISSQSTSGGGGNVAINLNTYAGGTFSTQYDYTLTPNVTTPPAVTPEPSSIILLGTGLLSAAGLMKRRFLA